MHVNQVRITYDNFLFLNNLLFSLKFNARFCAYVRIVNGINSLFHALFIIVIKINEIVFFDLSIELIIK